MALFDSQSFYISAAVLPLADVTPHAKINKIFHYRPITMREIELHLEQDVREIEILISDQ